jgi:hypothetical protein
MVAGGSNGITFSDSTNIAAANVTAVANGSNTIVSFYSSGTYTG